MVNMSGGIMSTNGDDIVHHDDNVSNLSFGDIIYHIDFVKTYMAIIDMAVMAHV